MSAIPATKNPVSVPNTVVIAVRLLLLDRYPGEIAGQVCLSQSSAFVLVFFTVKQMPGWYLKGKPGYSHIPPESLVLVLSCCFRFQEAGNMVLRNKMKE
jgi:hypothetical protein